MSEEQCPYCWLKEELPRLDAAALLALQRLFQRTDERAFLIVAEFRAARHAQLSVVKG